MMDHRGWIRRAAAITLIGGGLVACDIKASGFFAPRISDILATLRDIDAPQFSNLLPAAGRTGPLKVDIVSFDVRDLPGTNGARASLVDPSSVQVLLAPSGPSLAVTRSGDRYTANLGAAADGVVDIRVTAKDSAGNQALSSFNFTLDRSPPSITFVDTPPATWQSAASSVDMRVTGRIMDANIMAAAGTILRPGLDGACGTADDTDWPKGTAGGQVSENTFNYLPSVQLDGTFGLNFTAYNGVQAGGQPATGRYCIRVIASDRATDATGVATPNSSTSFYETRLQWNPPAPTTGSIAGLVSVSPTDLLSGVTVQTGTTTTTTGSDGRYRLTNIRAGANDVTVSGLPNGVVCVPSLKTATVVAGAEITLDFSCTRALSFALTLNLSYKHSVGFSTVCAAVSTNPPQPNAPYQATFAGPPGGVQGSGQQTGTLSSVGATFLSAAGTALITNDINLFGTYSVTVTVGGVTASKSIAVTGAAGTCP
jgi:hypothetical protein